MSAQEIKSRLLQFWSGQGKMTLWMWLITAATFLVVLAAAAIAIFSYNSAYADKIFRGVRVGFIDISGLTQSQALEFLKGQSTIFQSDGLPFRFKEQEVRLKPTVSAAADLDLTYEIFSLDLDQTVAQAFQYGREGSWPSRLLAQGQALISPKVFNVYYKLNEQGLTDYLKTNFSKFETVPQDAKLSLKVSTSESFEASVIEEKSGQVFEYEKAIEAAKNAMSNLQYSVTVMNLIEKQPEIFSAQAQKLFDEGELKNFLDSAPVKIVYEDKSWTISQNNINSWLDFARIEDKLTFALKGPGLHDFLKSIAKEIDQLPLDAKFKIKNDRVVEFQGSQEGVRLNILATVDRLNKALLQSQKEFAAQVEKVQPQIATANVNDLGIKEMIGVGKSNFARSPQNRRHNIRVGADALNGILIKPGEEFSLIKALGEISGATGYREELVIKGNKTIPEFGGGLCQIGTTTFRAALGTGLPVTERRNHSYRVVYYEPAGVDATIYSPKPDFKFINDTGSHILIQTKIVGSDLIFEFWGTKDDRQVEQSKPRIYNVTAPPPTEIIETEDLKPGEKKCTERAHAGADAEFDYKVTYSNGEVKEVLFKSRYVPWREVCLVGKQPTTDDGLNGISPDGTSQSSPGSTPVLTSPDLPVLENAPAPAPAATPPQAF